jgi:hypothetical protein
LNISTLSFIVSTQPSPLKMTLSDLSDWCFTTWCLTSLRTRLSQYVESHHVWRVFWRIECNVISFPRQILQFLANQIFSTFTAGAASEASYSLHDGMFYLMHVIFIFSFSWWWFWCCSCAAVAAVLEVCGWPVSKETWSGAIKGTRDVRGLSVPEETRGVSPNNFWLVRLIYSTWVGCNGLYKL